MTLLEDMALKNVWAYTYIPRTILGDGVGGYGYLKSIAYPSYPQSKKKESPKESQYLIRDSCSIFPLKISYEPFLHFTLFV